MASDLHEELLRVLEAEYARIRFCQERYVCRQFPILQSQAEDIVSDAIVLTLKKLDQLDSVSVLEPWIHRIVAFKSLEALRKAWTKKVIRLSQLVEDHQCALELLHVIYQRAGVKPDEDGATSLVSLEKAQEVREFIAALPDDTSHPYRSTAGLLMEGKRAKEIAQELGRELGSVYRWIHELRELLRIALKGLHHDI